MLLGPHPDLYERFCLFIPAQQRRNVVEKVESLLPFDQTTLVPAPYHTATNYIGEIKVRAHPPLILTPQARKSDSLPFLMEMLSVYQTSTNADFEYLCASIEEMFANAPDLMIGFSQFLSPVHTRELITIATVCPTFGHN